MLKKRDIERIAESLDCHFYNRPWEGQPYVKRQLKGLSGPLSIHNDELMEYVWNGSDRGLAVCILYQMGRELIAGFIGVCPVLQDYLGKELEMFSDVITDMGQRNHRIAWAKQQNLSLTEEEALPMTTEQQESMEDFATLLQQLERHVEIGRRLGLPGKYLGVYDVLMEWYYEWFDPSVVDAARELSDWIFAPHRGRSHESLVKELDERVTQLKEKYGFQLGNQNMVISYIGMEITHWLRLSDVIKFPNE